MSGLLAAILQIAAKRWRNGRLIARGEPGYKDVMLVPLWIPGAVAGILLGALAGGLWDGWMAPALAAAALPAAFAVLAIGVAIAQSRR